MDIDFLREKVKRLIESEEFYQVDILAVFIKGEK